MRLRHLICRCLVAFGAALAVACSGSSEPDSEAQSHTSGDPIPGRYILVFDPDVVEIRQSTVLDQDGQLIQLLSFVNDLFLDDVLNALIGPFVALNTLVVEIVDGVLPPYSSVAAMMADTPGLLYIEQDRRLSLAPRAVLDDAVSALVNLGYRRGDAFGAVTGAMRTMGGDAPVEDLIRAGLKELTA